MAVSRLRPTPETGRMAATKQAATPIGPSWSDRAGRAARSAFRQARRQGDSEGAMAVALKAEDAGLAPSAGIGSAESRMAGEYRGRQADTAVVSEIGGALAAGRTAPTSGTTTPAGPVQGGPGGVDPRPPGATTTQPPIPEAKPAPGATAPPENPVTGNATPETGDAPARLGARPAINPLTKKPFGFDPRAAPPSKATGTPEDFGARVRELTSADGENLTRGDAVRKVNSERAAAGKAPLNYDDAIGGLLEQDRQASGIRSKENSIQRGYDELGKELSAVREDPRIAARKAPPLPKPPPAAQAEAPTAPAPAPTPRVRQAGDPRPLDKQVNRLYGSTFPADSFTSVSSEDVSRGFRKLTGPIYRVGQKIGGAIERRAQENRLSAQRYNQAEAAAEALRKARSRNAPR